MIPSVPLTMAYHVDICQLAYSSSLHQKPIHKIISLINQVHTWLIRGKLDRRLPFLCVSLQTPLKCLNLNVFVSVLMKTCNKFFFLYLIFYLRCLMIKFMNSIRLTNITLNTNLLHAIIHRSMWNMNILIRPKQQ